MKKSQFEQLVREVIRETIRKVDGKYVVYPEKGGKRLGTHSTKKAAEKQLTAIHLNKEAVEPNFDFEWEEAARYPEFKKLGKDKWIELAKTGKAIEITSAKDINNTDANEPNAFKTLDPNKQKRALAQLKSGNVEMPIVALYSDGYKELVAGNTRLTAMMAQNKKATIWQFEVPEELIEAVDTDNMLTVLSVVDGKRNLANDQISQLFSDDVGGTFYIYTNEEGEYEDLKPISRQEAYKYIDYYNARLKKDHEREEKLGAELGVLGIESELQFNRGEFKTDPTVFSVNEQEMSQDDFNTVANVLRDSNKAKQIHSLLLQMFPQQKELLNYNYKNDSYAEFKRFIFFIDKYKLEGPVAINHTDLKLEPENMKDRERKYQDYITGKIDKYFRDTNADPRKVDLSKVPPITVDQNGFVTDGNHRAFLAIKQQKPLKGYKIVNANNTHPNVAKILQIVGREVKENYADGKVKEVFTPSPLQNLINDYLFLVTMNFTHIEKTGKTPKDVDALTQMIRHAKSDVSKLKDLSKEQLEKNRNNILQRIHDMLTYIISRMKAHMRPEEYEKRRGRLNKLLTLYKDAASVKENYADGKVNESGYEEAWELLGQPVPEIKNFVKQLGLKNDDATAKKIGAIIDDIEDTSLLANEIPKLKNLANKGNDSKILKAVQQISGKPDAEQQYTKLMQARDAGEKRNRGYDVSDLIKKVKSGNYESPVLLQLPSGLYVIGGRTRLYAALALGVKAKVKIITSDTFKQVKENYADGKVKGKSRPGRVKRSGASCKGSVTDLRAKAKKYGGEKGKMYHWCANMKSGRK